MASRNADTAFVEVKLLNAAGHKFPSGYPARRAWVELTMTDADMQLADADQSDPFDFYPARYLSQLVAGYSRTTERGGLKVIMPDYGDLGGARGRVPPPAINR